MNTTTEEWRDVPDHLGYQVSNLGRVRSTRRVLRGDVTPRGYVRITFLMGSRDKRQSYLVHRLVAAAFCDKPEGCEQVNHIDGNRSNNVWTNLEWVSAVENVRHGVRRRRATVGLTGAWQTFVWSVEAQQISPEMARDLPEFFRGSEGYWAIRWNAPSGAERQRFLTDKEFRAQFAPSNPNPAGSSGVRISPDNGSHSTPLKDAACPSGSEEAAPPSGPVGLGPHGEVERMTCSECGAQVLCGTFVPAVLRDRRGGDGTHDGARHALPTRTRHRGR